MNTNFHVIEKDFSHTKRTTGNGGGVPDKIERETIKENEELRL